MFKKTILFISFLSLILTALSLPLVTQAQIIDPNASSTGGGAPYAEGDYTLDDILAIAVGASRWILGIVGSLALIMFIYGGFMFLISAGSSEKISQAQKIIVAAVIGLIIVFASYLIIKFVLQSLGLNWDGTTNKMKPVSRSELILTLK